MNYTIGYFSKILGITVDTLRLYEKCGIVEPAKNKENSYRYFNDLDARKLLLSRWYRSMNISLNDVTELVNNPTAEKITQKIEETELDLKEKIMMDNLLLNKILEIKKDIIDIPSSLHQFKFKKMPGIYRLKQTDKNILLKDNLLKDIINNWMNSFPFTFRSIRLNKNSFYEENCLDYNWGLAIFEDEVKYFDLTINDSVEHLSAKTYISTVIQSSSSEEYLSRASIQFILDYLNQNNYTIIDDIIGKLIITENINEKDQTYIELDIPIAY